MRLMSFLPGAHFSAEVLPGVLRFEMGQTDVGNWRCHDQFSGRQCLGDQYNSTTGVISQASYRQTWTLELSGKARQNALVEDFSVGSVQDLHSVQNRHAF